MSQTIDTILISHSHKDELYAKELVDIIKVTKIVDKGVKIICSSYPEYGIPGDVNIYDYLKQELQSNIWVVYLLSPYYYESAGCLNEMGATWVQNKKYSTILTPNFSFDELKGAIVPSQKSFKLNVKTDLNDFINVICEEYKLKFPFANILESVRDESLKTIEEISKEELKISRREKVEFETVRKIDGENIEIVLRVINQNNYPISFTFISGTLKDISGNIYKFEEEISDICVYSGENKLIFRRYPLKDSNYSACKHEKDYIEDFRFLKAH